MLNPPTVLPRSLEVAAAQNPDAQKNTPFFLDGRRSALAIAFCLLPAFLLLFLPAAFHANEVNYFMLALRRVSPESFLAFSAAFDASHARIVWETILGYPIKWFGYDSALWIFRLGMAVGYASAMGYLLSALKLSAFDGLLAFGIFLICGEDILGKEWLFQGVESKTFAYALIMVALGLFIRSRQTYGICVAVLATYLHFLVGGFWFLALLAFDALRDFSPRRLVRLFFIYAFLISPLCVLIAYEQLAALGGGAHEASANMIYALRARHHIAPFLSLHQMRIWAPDIAFLFALLVLFLGFLRFDRAKSHPLVPWIIGLLCYLVVALGLSALDARTAYLGKFYLFRPSSLTLLCAIIAAIMLFNSLEDKYGIKRSLRNAAFLIVALGAALNVVATKLSDFGENRRAQSEAIAQMNAFILKTTTPDDILLVQPEREFDFPAADLPMLIERPTLVSYKFVPTNARDIYRWNDLIQYRDRVFGEGCKGISRFPVRYLILIQGPEMKIPCGKVVWSSNPFVLVEP